MSEEEDNKARERLGPHRQPMHSPELTLLFEALSRQLQGTQQDLVALRTQAMGQIEVTRQACEVMCDRLRKETEERLHAMNGDMDKLREEVRKLREEDLQDLRKAIIGNQSENYKRIIGAQAAVLLLVLSAVVGLLIQQFHH